MRMKFDGGRVINRSQSGEHRCMGAGLRQNLGLKTWSAITGSEPNGVFRGAVDKNDRKIKKDRKRKQTEEEKANRKRTKICEIK